MEAERKQRAEKSVVIVERLVRIQLHAMGCESFDIGIKRDAGVMILREGQDVLDIKATIIYVRPEGRHPLSLIDDLSAGALERMKAEGFEPAVVVETSLDNFQVWLNYGQVLGPAASTRAAKQLAERFGGDPSSADWRHFGRLAGFTNPKRERQLPSGMRPFVRLRFGYWACLLEGGRVHRRHRNKQQWRTGAGRGAAQATAPAPGATLGNQTRGGVSRRSRICKDLHRADMAWAKHAARCGRTMEQIKDELLDGEISKKGTRKRQEYAERAARKAVDQIRGLPWVRGR